MTSHLHNTRITLAQINPVVGDIAGNLARIRDIIAPHTQNSDIIVFPELVTCGYPPEDLILRPAFIDSIEQEIEALCAAHQDDTCLLISTPWRKASLNEEENKDAVYNAVLAIQSGEIKGIYAKRHLPNYGVFDEKRIFTASPFPDILNINGLKIGVLTCEDLWFPDVAQYLKDAGAQILISPNASPYDIHKQAERHNIIKARCAETSLPVIYVNQIGGQDELVFDGGSFVADQDGNTLHQMPFCQAAVHSVTLSVDEQGEQHRTALSCDQNSLTIPEAEALLYDVLCLGLRDYVSKNGFKGLLLGLSGGIDSALSAVIACDAIGAENVHCVMMPSPYTAQESLDDAKTLAENLGCQYDIQPIEAAMHTFTDILGNEITQGVTHENIQSRSRGLILMALSNASGYMVLSTGNKSEMAVGYATLYGDMCGGFNALKDLYKMQVFALSRYSNTRAGYERMPENIITRPPSAELRPDQKDEDSLPPYETLDAILEAIIEQRLSLQDITAKGYAPETIKRIWGLLDRAEYKRRQAPPGIKVTTTSFGRERRYPITNQYREE